MGSFQRGWVLSPLPPRPPPAPPPPRLFRSHVGSWLHPVSRPETTIFCYSFSSAQVARPPFQLQPRSFWFLTSRLRCDASSATSRRNRRHDCLFFIDFLYIFPFLTGNSLYPLYSTCLCTVHTAESCPFARGDADLIILPPSSPWSSPSFSAPVSLWLHILFLVIHVRCS